MTANHGAYGYDKNCTCERNGNAAGVNSPSDNAAELMLYPVFQSIREALLSNNKFLGKWFITTAQMPSDKEAESQDGKSKETVATPRYFPQ